MSPLKEVQDKERSIRYTEKISPVILKNRYVVHVRGENKDVEPQNE